MIQLKSSVLSAERVQQILAGLAVGAVRLGEDDNAVLVDEGLSLGLCGGHGGGRGTGEGAEETLEDERNVGRVSVEKKPGGGLFYCYIVVVR